MKVVNVKALLLNSVEECDKISHALRTAYTVSEEVNDEEGTTFYKGAMHMISDIKQSIVTLRGEIDDIQE